MDRLTIVSALVVLGCAAAHAQWQPQSLDTDADLRGLSIVTSKVAWVSGTRGTFARTVDGGQAWSVGTVRGAEKLDFRDVEAFGEATAYLLSAGPGEDSRIYKTHDGGRTWVLQFKNADHEGFFDALAFWDEKTGLAFGDPVNGRFQLVATSDGGATWKPLPSESLPAALPGEGAFAASGTCLITHGLHDVWFATGGAKVARVFHSGDRGRTWTTSETPMTAGAASAGVFSIAFRDRKHGVIVGGDYRKPSEVGATIAVTADAGKTWVLGSKTLPYRSAVAWAKDRWVAVGPSGSHVSLDDGATWKELDRVAHNSVAFTSTGTGWAAGPKGRVAKFEPTTAQARDWPASRFDKMALDRAVDGVLKKHGDEITTSLWLGGSATAWYERGPADPQPTASAIKSFYLVELFAAHAAVLDRPLPGADAVLEDMTHPAISHFTAAQQDEIRKALRGASVRRIGEVMIGAPGVSNAVYNAAANLVTAALGGPQALTELIRKRDPAFKMVSARRYMLRDRKTPGDNEAPSSALAALYTRLAARKIQGIEAKTIDAIRAVLLRSKDDARGAHFAKTGALQSDPLTQVRAGWWETAKGPVVYVVMTCQATPGQDGREATGRRLTATADALTDALVAAGRSARE